MLISLESLPQFVKRFLYVDLFFSGAESSKGLRRPIQGNVVLKSFRSRAILGALDILVDIGVPAEKEVIL
jgi:hypothetical protein